jgi:hypothetical protein
MKQHTFMSTLGRGIVVVVAGVSLAGCAKSAAGTSTMSAASTTSTTGITTTPTPSLAATAKVGTTTKTGMITKVGNTYLLGQGATAAGIDSYNIDLSQYVGQTVTVSGEYSGDTLFVTKVN